MRQLLRTAALLSPLALLLASGVPAIGQDKPEPQPTPAPQETPAPTPKPALLPDPTPSGLSTMYKYGYHHGKCWRYEILIKTSGSASQMTIVSTIASVTEIPCDKAPPGTLPPPANANATGTSQTSSTTGTTGTTSTTGTTGQTTTPPADPPAPPSGWPPGVGKQFEGDDEIWTYPDGHKERYRRPKETKETKTESRTGQTGTATRENRPTTSPRHSATQDTHPAGAHKAPRMSTSKTAQHAEAHRIGRAANAGNATRMNRLGGIHSMANRASMMRPAGMGGMHAMPGRGGLGGMMHHASFMRGGMGMGMFRR